MRCYFLSLREITDLSATKGQIATTAEENLERLADAGFLVEDLIPVCFNCNTKGHGKSECPEAAEGIIPVLPPFYISPSDI